MSFYKFYSDREYQEYLNKLTCPHPDDIPESEEWIRHWEEYISDEKRQVSPNHQAQ